MDSRNVFVCDNGTGYVKCGFAGENFPTSVFPCVVGRPMLRYEESLMEQELKDTIVGAACSELRHQLDISYILILLTMELIDVEGDGMADMVFRCIQEMDIDNCMMLYQHIVLSGWSTMYPGLPSRIDRIWRYIK
ncbi:hypothetical protein Dsin_007492 [Dipteronia sinensis]|uniref:Actin-related protein 2 n=1 Tax=Dipteronia sinensis TaxID=43782 RepID=A0AAE0B185_9ROSI|nr:hypothetical protein Dsin_007492 [Dipteronia sinensis]